MELRHINLARSGVQRDRKGRVILPELEQMRDPLFRTLLTPQVATELRREVRRRRRWWRLWTTLLLSFIGYKLLLHLWIIPSMIYHWWPFR